MNGIRFGRFDYALYSSYLVYAGSSVCVPVLLPDIAESLGFSLTETGGMGLAGALQFGRSGMMLVTMIFSPMLAAVIGLRRALGWSILLLMAMLALCSGAGSYWQLALALTFAGISEGTLEALISPAVQQLHDGADAERYMNITHSFWSLGVLLLTLFCAAVVQFHWPWRPAVALTAVSGIPAVCLFLLRIRQPGRLDCRQPMNQREMFRNFGRLFAEWRFYPYLAAIFFAGGAEWVLTFWAASYLRLQVHVSPLLGGVGMAVFAAGMMGGRFASGVLVSGRKLLPVMLILALGGAVLGAVLTMVTALPLLLVLIFLSGVAVAPMWPSLQSCCVRNLPHLDGSSVYIILSCSGIPGCAVFVWLVGKCTDCFGFSGALLLLLPGALLMLALLLLLIIRSGSRGVRP